MFGLFGKKEEVQVDFSELDHSVELNKIDNIKVRKALENLHNALKASAVPVDGEYHLEAFGKPYTLCYKQGRCIVRM